MGKAYTLIDQDVCEKFKQITALKDLGEECGRTDSFQLSHLEVAHLGTI